MVYPHLLAGEGRARIADQNKSRAGQEQNRAWQNSQEAPGATKEQPWQPRERRAARRSKEALMPRRTSLAIAALLWGVGGAWLRLASGYHQKGEESRGDKPEGGNKVGEPRAHWATVGIGDTNEDQGNGKRKS